jgi:multidrug efflux pump subunit AcrA (membrane-fusion protein)
MKISKKGKIAIGGILLLMLILVGYFVSQNSSKLDVNYYSVIKGDVITEISGQGKINSGSVVTEYALADGEIVDFNYDIGDKVKKGDIIAKISEDNINFQIEGIDAQIANLDYKCKKP